MPTGVIRVEGARKLRDSLTQAGYELDDLKEAHKEAADIVVPVAKADAPVVSGRLQSTVRGTGSATTAVIRAGYASVPYANPIHWGWRKRNIRKHPFVSQAAQTTESRWAPVYRAKVQKIMEKVKGA